ncbi:gastrula zinc finger protein xFG20-1-like isoform X8 [Dicentrarchus labrax]|uniref:gastrula zinc finger protein xFG20-1-like isoform X8 n=1 Tax=Dicentrarchus labrax TaxID=13489 RepID=UPI0021F667FA|nr:gastrula zinc finger protein xFG20-1-like isoform X8 [Dicentrarchus labrax]
MCKVQMLRALVKQRLTAAAEEIFGLFERTIAEYEEELCRSKEENERQRKLLDAVFNPQLRLHRADVQQLSVIKEEVPPEQQQEWRPSLEQGDPEPPHVKEEQVEVRTSQEGEQLQGFTFTPVPVKSEDDDEEKPQSSKLPQRQTEQMETDDGEDCGGPEPARNSDEHSQPDTDGKTEDSSESETDDSDNDFKDTREPQSGDVPNIKPFSCSVCKKCFSWRRGLRRHLRTHTGEKPFSCSACDKSFSLKGILKHHMTTHTGEKPFSCSVCDKSFGYKHGLQDHMRTHTGEKPFNCSVCHKSFRQKSHLQMHMQSHIGGIQYSCSVCDKRFGQKSHLQRHMKTHTGKKPFSCSVCQQNFVKKSTLEEHMTTHTSSSVCS